MRIKFWGTRGSIPVPGIDTTVFGGNTTCVEITLDSGKTIIIDAGSGIRLLGRKLLNEERIGEIYLLITHIHWDHVMGFPFFDPIYNPASRIYIDGNRNCLKGLRYTFDNKMGDGFFPVKFDDLRAEIKYLGKLPHGPLEIDGTVIDSIPLHHPQGGKGFRFCEGNRKMVFLTDNELRGKPWEGRSLEDYAAFSQDADILIHDAQYTPEEIGSRLGWGHSDYSAAFEMAFKASVKKLILFHHDPPRTDSQMKSLVENCRILAEKEKSEMVIDAAIEGVEYEL
jgi:phosphoribosyl 1,2-cyclic phosphodiesterase